MRLNRRYSLRGLDKVRTETGMFYTSYNIGKLSKKLNISRKELTFLDSPKTHRAGERVMSSVTRFLENKLKLKVNHSKSGVDYAHRRKFLGFSFTCNKEARIRISKESLKRLKDKIRLLTNPCWSISIETRIEILNKYLSG